MEGSVGITGARFHVLAGNECGLLVPMILIGTIPAKKQQPCHTAKGLISIGLFSQYVSLLFQL
ncbi:hypothetical protein NF212_22885 [Parasalinivibrio latis]|uniref:hypothetical protein n=1 Tax=Parasalinivibrio latis TaxID=2952610 RepID=UPI0030E3E576